MAAAEGADLDGDLNVAELGSGTAGTDADLAGAQAELEAMRERLAAMEAESNKLKDYQSKAEAAAGLAPQDSSGEAEAKVEADGRSVYVGNVDYAVTPEELQLHFQSAGTVNRVTILTDRMGNPKGFAYIEFLEADAVASAVLLSDTELHGRALKVSPKRTNVPGLKQGRGRGRFPPRGRGGYGRGPPRGGYGGYGGGYGYMPRGRGRGRFYSPY